MSVISLPGYWIQSQEQNRRNRTADIQPGIVSIGVEQEMSLPGIDTIEVEQEKSNQV